jgi:hypothetical protein
MLVTRADFRYHPRKQNPSMLKNILCVSAVALALIATGISHAQVKQGKTRPARTSALMKGAIKPNCEVLKKAVDTAPADDKAWKTLSYSAAVVNEMSYALMEDGRCPDSKWADANKSLQDGSAAMLAAITAKDHAAFKSAFGKTMQSCKACHDAHKEH